MESTRFIAAGGPYGGGDIRIGTVEHEEEGLLILVGCGTEELWFDPLVAADLAHRILELVAKLG